MTIFANVINRTCNYFFMATSLTKSQQNAFNLFKNGANIFLTGKGGSGKSFLTRHIIEWCQGNGKSVMVCAPTGVAAQNIQGSTIHRAFKAPVGIIDTKGSMSSNKRCFDGKVIKKLKKTSVIVIDEISMVRADLFCYVANTILFVEKEYKKKIQLLVVGDFFQLPPVLVKEEKPAYEGLYGNALFAFQTLQWSQLKLQTVVLVESMRQSDQKFVTALDHIREGIPEFGVLSKCQADKEDPSAITICGTNKEAFNINDKNLRTLTKHGAKEHTYTAEVSGSLSPSEWPTEKELRLCEGARVIMLNNDPDGRWVNGSFATVKELVEDEDRMRVDIEDGNTVEIERYTWKIMEYQLEDDEKGEKKLVQRERASVNQFPMKLAWAISIHKSQGQTYDRVNVNVKSIFTYGQLYVSLSRCKTLAGMRIIGELTDNKVMACPEVIQFMKDGSITAEAPTADSIESPLFNDRYQEGWDDGYAFRSLELEALYQERLANDPSVKKLSPRVAREREKDAIPEEVRNPRNAGRKPKPESERRPSKAIRVPLAIADVLKELGTLYESNPDLLVRCQQILEEFKLVKSPHGFLEERTGVDLRVICNS